MSRVPPCPPAPRPLRGVRRLTRRLTWRCAREDGAATIEFVILFPIVFSLFLAGVEAGVVLTRHVMLERGLDIAMRALRLGQVMPVTLDALRERICRETMVIPNCRENLMIELRRLEAPGMSLPTQAASCVNRESETQPAVNLNPGAEHDLMLVRVCLLYDPMFPSTGWGLALTPEEGSGAFQISAASAYVNEP